MFPLPLEVTQTRGTSPTLPLRTLPFAATLSKGSHSLLLRQGDLFDLASPLTLSLGSGSVDGTSPPSLLGSYADGQPAATTFRPWVRFPTPSAGPVLLCVDCAGLTVSGLEVSGGEQGLLFSFSAPGGWGGLAVSDCHFHDVRGVRPGGNPLAWGTGVGFNTSQRTDVSAVNITVTHNLFSDSDTAYQNCITAQTHGGCLWPSGGSGGGYVNLDGVLFSRNLVNHVSFNAAFFAFTRHTRVEGNVFLNDDPQVLFPLGTTDIIVGEADGTLALVGNEIANRGEVKGGPDGCGIDLEDSSDSVLLADNYVSNTVGAGIMLFAGTGGGSKNITLRRNTLLLDGCNQTSGDHGVLAFLHPHQTGLLDSNVLAACPGKQVYTGDSSGFLFSNNTVLNVSASTPLPVAAAPIVTATATGADGLLVTATCATPGATLRYTLDGGRVTEGDALWPSGGVAVVRATGVLVKAFAPGLLESPSAGGVFDGRQKKVAG